MYDIMGARSSKTERGREKESCYNIHTEDILLPGTGTTREVWVLLNLKNNKKKEGNVLFRIIMRWTYGKGSPRQSERKPAVTYTWVSSISSKGSFIYTIPQTG